VCSSDLAADHELVTTAELGLELDSNVQRIEETQEGGSDSAPMLRLAGRGDLAASTGGGSLTLLGGANLRTSLLQDITSENFAQVSLDGQWTRPIREGEARIGPRLSYRDAFALADDASERTFRSVAAEGVLVLYGGEGARVTVSGGTRFFKFKPNDLSTWRGLGAAARGDFPLWRGGQDGEDSLDLTVVTTIEQRAYRATAYTNTCAEGSPIVEDCFLRTQRPRGDRLHRASAMLAYAGGVVASLEAQLTVLDSNSYGRSSTSGRLRGAVTFSYGDNYITTTGTLSLETYVDRLLVARDPDGALFEVLEDDNRSSLDLRLGRLLSESTVLEWRLAGWLSLSDQVDYQRVLGSVGVVWTK
jgi:hypothetical protein